MMCSGYDLVNLECSKKHLKRVTTVILIFILLCFHLKYCIICDKKVKTLFKINNVLLLNVQLLLLLQLGLKVL